MAIIKIPKFIEFKVSNFRSILDEVTLSMEAKKGINDWPDNTFEIQLAGGNENIRLVKTAAIYGANASGKSNFIKAFATFKQLLSTTSIKNLEDSIEYEPYLLDKSIEGLPTAYSFDFIGGNLTRYLYKFSHNSKEIIDESLASFSGGQFIDIFRREREIITLSDNLKYLNTSTKTIAPRLFLSHLANNEANELVGEIYKNIQKIITWSFTNSETRSELLYTALNNMAENIDNNQVSKWVNLLIKNADFQTLSISMKEKSEEIVGKFDERAFLDTKKSMKKNYEPYTLHKLFNKGKEEGTRELSFSESASEGTKFFIGLVGVFALMIENGLPCLFDEINTSLHPDLCRLIVKLLNDPLVNTNNAQLIFSTHDISLIDKTFLRRDQVWFTEKNNLGSTVLYSAQDFDNVPDTATLGELYDTGFFRAKPKINETAIKFND